MNSIERGAEIGAIIKKHFQTCDTQSVEQITQHVQEHIEDATLDEVAQVLHTLEAHDVVSNVSDDMWAYNIEQSMLRDAVIYTRELGLLDRQPTSDDLEPVELLAHFYNLSDWMDVQHNQIDTSRIQEYHHVRQTLSDHFDS